MSYLEQLNRVKEQRRLFDSMGSRWQGDPDSPYLKMEQAHRKIMDDYYDREIDRLTNLAIEEMVMEKLKSIDYNVSLNGDKITDAIVTKITKGLGGK